MLAQMSSRSSRSPSRPLPVLQPGQDPVHPLRSFAALRALAAGFLGVEPGNSHGRLHHAGGVVHDDDARRSQHASGLCDGVKVQRNVYLIGCQDRDGGSSRDDRFECVTVAHPAAVVVNQLPRELSHRKFIDSPLLHVAADAKQARPRVAVHPDRRKPLRAVVDDVGNVRQGFDVVDDRRRTVQSDDGGEWRLQARVPAFSLDGFQQRRLFSADVRARSAVNNQIEIESRTQNIFAQVPLVIGFAGSPCSGLPRRRQIRRECK